MEVNQITGAVIGAAIEVHCALGPGLLESAYEECLCRELTLRRFPSSASAHSLLNAKVFAWIVAIVLIC